MKHGNGTKRVIQPSDVPTPPGLPVAAGVAAGPFAFVSGQSATDYSEGIVKAAQPDIDSPFTGALPVTLQTDEIYRKLGRTLDECGSSLANSVKVNQWIATHHDRFDPGNRQVPRDERPSVHHEEWRETAHPYLRGRDRFIFEKRPASVMVPVDRLLSLPASVEADMVAITAESGWSKEEITTDSVPAPLAGYSEAIVAGPWIFVSGFSATDYKNGLPPQTQPYPWYWIQDKLELETDFVLNYLEAVLAAAGGGTDTVVKSQIFLNEPRAVRHFPALDAVWRRHFPGRPPARTVFASNGNGLKDTWVEIDVIALRRDSGVSIEQVHSDQAAPALGHASQAVLAGNMLFMSTGLPLDAAGKLVGRENPELPFSGLPLRAQMEQILANADALCTAAGGSVRDVVRTHVAFSDLRDFGLVREPWVAAFGDSPPTATFVEVPPAPLIPGARLALDMWAYIE
jgi:enamine deaminase RidA (YjgF/YER057c/UK114 family)